MRPARSPARAYATAAGLDPSTVHSDFFDGETVNHVPFSWLAGYGFALDGSSDGTLPPGKPQSVLEHYVADLDPSDLNSVFRIISLERAGDTTVNFVPSSPGRVYTLEYCDNLIGGIWQPVDGPQGTPGHMVFGGLQDTDATAPTRFYRVKVEIPGTNGLQ